MGGGGGGDARLVTTDPLFVKVLGGEMGLLDVALDVDVVPDSPFPPRFAS